MVLSAAADRMVGKAVVALSLAAAIALNDPVAVERLLNSGVCVHTGGASTIQPVMAAAFVGSVPIVRILVKYGANVDATDDFGVTPLMLAARRDNAEMVRELLGFGADPVARDKSGRDALWHGTRREIELRLPGRFHGTLFVPRLWDTMSRRLIADQIRRMK